MASIPLFLDCDPGIDDAVALGHLFSQPDVEVLGIAASGGNVSTEQTVRNTMAGCSWPGAPTSPSTPAPSIR